MGVLIGARMCEGMRKASILCSSSGTQPDDASLWGFQSALSTEILGCGVFFRFIYLLLESLQTVTAATTLKDASSLVIYFWLHWGFVPACGLSLVATHRLLTAVASLVAKHGLLGARAQ